MFYILIFIVVESVWFITGFTLCVLVCMYLAWYGLLWLGHKLSTSCPCPGLYVSCLVWSVMVGAQVEYILSVSWSVYILFGMVCYGLVQSFIHVCLCAALYIFFALLLCLITEESSSTYHWRTNLPTYDIYIYTYVIILV